MPVSFTFICKLCCPVCKKLVNGEGDKESKKKKKKKTEQKETSYVAWWAKALTDSYTRVFHFYLQIKKAWLLAQLAFSAILQNFTQLGKLNIFRVRNGQRERSTNGHFV
jgi:hypothetical protein